MALGSDVWVVVYSGGAFCVVVVVHGGVCLWGTLVCSTQHGTAVLCHTIKKIFLFYYRGRAEAQCMYVERFYVPNWLYL